MYFEQIHSDKCGVGKTCTKALPFNLQKRAWQTDSEPFIIWELRQKLSCLPHLVVLVLCLVQHLHNVHVPGGSGLGGLTSTHHCGRWWWTPTAHANPGRLSSCPWRPMVKECITLRGTSLAADGTVLGVLRIHSNLHQAAKSPSTGQN